ncbi:MAG: hypothetical protein JWP03_5191, partial [Phycisphaerales bacterium]|nr:hypothetical protein [Phycisphaerales bacterium]
VASKMVGEYAHPTCFRAGAYRPGRSEAPNYFLSPEYEGEGTGAGLRPGRGGTPRF